MKEDLMFDEYQRRAHSTCKDTCDNPDYPVCEMIEELAEYEDKYYAALPEDFRQDVQIRSIHTAMQHAGKLAKARAKSVRYGEVPNVVTVEFNDTQRLDMAYELGDVLWGLSEAARKLGYRLSEVGSMNNAKLASRKKRDKIDGDGDHR